MPRLLRRDSYDWSALMQKGTFAVARCALSWLAQAVGIVVRVVSVFPATFTTQAVTMASFVAFIWTVYLAASLVRWAAARDGG